MRPREVAGRTRRQLAVDLVEDLTGLDRKLKDLDKRLKTAVAATGTSLTAIHGVGTATAAMIVGDVRRFPTRHHFATYSGVAPIEVSSGQVQRHRLSRAGNRRLNHALHIIALSNKRCDDRGAAYYAKKIAAGKGKKGALRCLKQRLSDSIYRQLVEDQQQRTQRSPGGQSGTTLQSSATGSHPNTGTSDQPHTGLHPEATPGLPAAS